MNVKILKLCLMIFVIAVFSGCSCPKPKPIYIDKPVEVLVPIKCEAPITHCDFNKSTYTEVIASLRLCIEDFRKNEEVCR